MGEKKTSGKKRESGTEKAHDFNELSNDINKKIYIVIEDLELILIEYFYHSRCSKFNQTKRIRFER